MPLEHIAEIVGVAEACGLGDAVGLLIRLPEEPCRLLHPHLGDVGGEGHAYLPFKHRGKIRGGQVDVGTQRLHAELLVGVVPGDVILGPLHHLPGGIAPPSSQQIVKPPAALRQPAAQLLQAGEIGNGHRPGEVLPEDLLHREAAGPGQPHQTGHHLQQKEVALAQGQPRVAQPVHQPPDHRLRLFLGAQLHGGGEGPLVLLFKGGGGGGLGLQVPDVDDPAPARQHPVVQGRPGSSGAVVQLLRPPAGQANPGSEPQAQVALGQAAEALQFFQKGVEPRLPVQVDQQGRHVPVEHHPGGAALQGEVLFQEGLDGQQQQLIPLPLVPQAVHMDQGCGPQALGQVDLIPGRPVLDLLRAYLAAQEPGVEQLPQHGEALLVPPAQGLHVPALQPLAVQLVPELLQYLPELRGVDGL